MTGQRRRREVARAARARPQGPAPTTGAVRRGVPGRNEDRGPFAGAGPRVCKRVDRRIHEDICDRLVGDGDVGATEIEASVTEGEVTFDGMVSDRGTKHDVECIGAECLGVTGVQSDLRTVAMGKRE
jgi:osmotically-inducible protein OsmY